MLELGECKIRLTGILLSGLVNRPERHSLPMLGSRQRDNGMRTLDDRKNHRASPARRAALRLIASAAAVILVTLVIAAAELRPSSAAGGAGSAIHGIQSHLIQLAQAVIAPATMVTGPPHVEDDEHPIRDGIREWGGDKWHSIASPMECPSSGVVVEGDALTPTNEDNSPLRDAREWAETTASLAGKLPLSCRPDCTLSLDP
jgi:hypothetical protein